MASEKGDLPQDTDSLPPNYASSEAFTDTAPPAYLRKTNTVRLQITRVVCLTVLTAGFLTGVFILGHTYISNRNNCDCSQAPNLPPISEALLQANVGPQVEVIMDEAPRITDLNNEFDASELDLQSRLMDIPLPSSEEIDSEETLELAQEAMEEEEDSLQSLVQDSANRVRLPINMLLGNPALAGKDVQCKVEKKVQNLGGGLLSKTIMVTCDDDDDDEESDSSEEASPFESMLSSRPAPHHPPMSLLAPILKMMATRANARLQRQMQPKVILRRFPQPGLQPIGVSMNGPFPQPMNMPFPARSFDGPMPFPPPMMNSGMQRVMSHPPPRSFQGPIQVHGNSFGRENIRPAHFFREQPSHEHMHQDGPNFRFNGNPNMNRENFEEMNQEQPQNMLFREDFDEEDEPRRPFMDEPEPIFRPFPPQQSEQPEIMEQKVQHPIKVIHGFPPQIPDAIKQIVSHIMKSTNKRDGQENMPVIAIKAIPESRSADSIQGPPRSKLLLPFPFRAMKMNSRGARMLENESFNGAPFPLPRGAMSAGLKPLVMPEAAGRALDSPVTLPSMPETSPLRFFPGRLLRLPVPLQGRAITHMEMKQNPNVISINDEDNQEKIEQAVPQNAREEPFGPPRRHTVIRGPPPMQDNISEDSSPVPPFLTRFPLPPPPRFAREGRTGIVREVNPDAELVTPAETRAHHIISVN